MTARVGHQAPDFTATALVGTEFKEISLKDYAGKYVVLFFYPLGTSWSRSWRSVAVRVHEAGSNRVYGLGMLTARAMAVLQTSRSCARPRSSSSTLLPSVSVRLVPSSSAPRSTASSRTWRGSTLRARRVVSVARSTSR